MSHTLLIPYDFSPAADEALRWAAREVADHGANATVLHVINPMPGASVTLPVITPPPSSEDLAAVRQELRDAMSRAGLTGHVRLELAPSPGEAVVQVAGELGATLVAMGTHGRGGLTRMVLGSVADHVIRHAPCPVLTVRAPKKA